MPANKSQHYLPQVLSKRFVGETGRLCRRDRRTGKVSFPLPKELGAKDHFYRVDVEGLDPNHYEKKLSDEVEGPAGDAFRAITAPGGFPPKDDVRASVARFIGTQLGRGPNVRNGLDGVATVFAEELLKAGVPEAALAGYVERTPDGFAWTKTRHVQLADTTRPIVNAERMRFALVVFEENALITSDCPVVTWLRREGADGFGVGINVPHAVSFHLDPRHALLGVADEVHRDVWDECIVSGTPEIARTLNEAAAAASWQFVGHHPEHEPLAGYTFPPLVTPREAMMAEIRASAARRPSAARHPTPATSLPMTRQQRRDAERKASKAAKNRKP